ncbi:hypothetical protein B0H19DRAFT_1055255 [Mycena capillaripes]|nr:hypothetical protein B0H19DRAFT_1055255 [Mycena capillaripes]
MSRSFCRCFTTGRQNEGVASRDIGSFILARECLGNVGFCEKYYVILVYEGGGSHGTMGRTRPGGHSRGTEWRWGFNQPASARINGFCPDHEAARRCLEISTCGLFCEFRDILEHLQISRDLEIQSLKICQEMSRNIEISTFFGYYLEISQDLETFQRNGL